MDRSLVTEMELRNESYEFDLFGIFWDGEHYWTGYDSGCSCPSSWDENFDPNTCEGPFTYRQALAALDKMVKAHGNNHHGWFVDYYRNAREELREHASQHETGMTAGT